MKSLAIQVSLLLLLTGLAGWLRFNHLGQVNLYNDEYYQFETAIGWLKTGEWVRYDFYNEASGKPYDRAKLFIVQVAASIRLFGESEWAARLPAAVWGTLLIPIVIITLLRVTKNQLLAYGTGFALTFDYLSISLSRYVRMYSLLMVCSVLIIFLFYKCLESKKRNLIILYGLSVIIVSLVSWFIFKELTLAVFGALGVYTTIRAGLYIYYRTIRDKYWFWCWVLGVIGVSIALILTLLRYNIVPLDAVIIRAQPHWSYIIDTLAGWYFPIFAGAFFVLGIILSLKKIRSYLGLTAIVSITVLVYFTFFSHRWDAQRYISIVVPAITLITVVGLVTTMKFLYSLLPGRNVFRVSLILPLVILVGPALSFKTDFTTTELGYADMKTAYSDVVDQVQPGDIVLMQGPRFFYWPDNSIPVYLLGGYKSLSLTEFKALTETSDTGVYVVYNTNHKRHLSDKVLNYIAKHFKKIYQPTETNVLIYYLNRAK